MAGSAVHTPGDVQGSIASQWALTAFALLFLGLRILLKLARTPNRSFFVDDILLILSFACLVVSCSLRTVAINYTESHAQSQPNPKDIAWNGLMNAVAGTLAQGGAMLSKTSFCFTLLRVVTGRMRTVIWFIIGSMNAVLALVIIFLLAQCKPIEASWNPFVKGDCWPEYIAPHYGIFASAYSVAMDFALVALVWKVILGLQMKKVEKYGVAVGMSMGIIAGITGIVKCVYVGQLNFLKIFIWESAEISVTIAAACIPVLRVFMVGKVRSIVSRVYGLGSGGTRQHTVHDTPVKRRQTNTFQGKHDEHGQDVPWDDKSESLILAPVPMSRKQTQSLRESV